VTTVEGGTVRVVLADDHPMYRYGVAAVLTDVPGVALVGQADSGAGLLALVAEVRPDVVITDMRMPDLSGIEVTRSLLADQPDLPVLVLTMHDDDESVYGAMRAGAQGYIAKQEAAEKLLTVIQQILAGKTYFSSEAQERATRMPVESGTDGAPTLSDLSDRELQVFQMIGDGKSTRQIAKDLNLSIKTIESYRAHIKDKLNLESGYALVQSAIYWNHFHPKA